MLSAPPEEEKKSGGGNGGWKTAAFFAILFLPAFIVGWIYYSMLRFFRQRFSVIASTVLLVDVLAIAAWVYFDAWGKVTDVVGNISQIQENWVDLIPAVLIVNIVIGGFFGMILTGVQVRQIKSNPHKTKLEGSWLYQFKFRRTPLQKWRRKRTIEGLKEGRFSSDIKAPLGLDENNGDVVAYRYNTEAVKPTLISGAAGSGKTITMLSMMKNDIEHGIPIIGIDFKRSPELATKLATWAEENGRKFYHFVNGDPEKYDVPKSPGQAFYDPLINGGASKPDMVLNMREYDTAAEVYKSSMRQLLQVLFSMFRHADKRKASDIDWGHGSIYQIASAITEGNFTDLVGSCEGTPVQKNAEDVEIGVRNRSSSLRRAMDELQGQMRTIVASEYGRWLRTEKDARNIDLFNLTKDDKDSVILFSLNADSEKDFSRYLGSLILSDLNAVSAKRRNLGMKNQVNVYVDEFQAVAPTAVTSLLEKSRESKIAMTLSSQSYEQIIAASDMNGEAYLLGILDTCSNFIVHNGATENSATRLAQILGKHYETVYTAANQNEGFLFSINFFNKRNQTVQTREEERWIMHPKEFMALSSPTPNNNYKSTAIIINKAPDDPLFKDLAGGAAARKVWMIPDDEVIGDYYVPTLSSDDNYDESDLAPALAELVNEDPNFARESNILEEDEQPPVDYLSERLSSKNSNNHSENFEEDYDDYYEDDSDEYYDDEEEADGDFGWENELSEEEDELSELSGVDWDSATPAKKPEVLDDWEESKPKPVRRRSALESTSFETLVKADKSSDKTNAKASTPVGKTRNGGIPKKPVVSKPSEKEIDEDFKNSPLPDFEGLL